jgi:hypothetical protein
MKNENSKIFITLKWIMVAELMCAMLIDRFSKSGIIKIDFIGENIGFILLGILIFTFTTFYLYWKIKDNSKAIRT